jgi:hypothetical protein
MDIESPPKLAVKEEVCLENMFDDDDDDEEFPASSAQPEVKREEPSNAPTYVIFSALSLSGDRVGGWGG